jgi:hypothetical protein
MSSTAATLWITSGTEGAVEITVGDDEQPVDAIWYREPSPPPSVRKAGDPKTYVAGATMVAQGALKGVPILPRRDKGGLVKASSTGR